MGNPGSQVKYGTWTPDLKGGGVSFTSYTTKTGNWARLGSTVLIDCYIQLTTTAGGSAGDVTLAGFQFPFQIMNNTSQIMDITTAAMTLSANSNTMIKLNYSSTTANLLQNDPTTSAAVNLQTSNLIPGSIIAFSFKYEAIV